jgi:hypothetical protein
MPGGCEAFIRIAVRSGRRYFPAHQNRIEEVVMSSVVSVASLVFAIVALAGPAWAQAKEEEATSGQTFFDVLKPEELKFYCIYRGEAYSTGAFMCEGRQANVCAGPDEPPSGSAKPTGRAYWRNSTADKVCGSAE